MESGRKRTFVMAGLAVAVVVATSLLAPLRTLAGNFLDIFEPRTVAFVPVTTQELRALKSLPDLSTYGTIRETARPSEASAANAVAASGLARFAVRVPPAAAVTGFGAPQFRVISPSVERFTFSAARARAAAAAKGLALPAMPAGLDASTLQLSTGAAVVATYGAPIPGRAHRHRLVIAQMPLPRIWSTGASAAAIEQYMLAQPGISPRLAAAFRALGDPATTLPLPVPVDRAYAEPVTVDGVRGVGIGDNTGIGAAVVWQRGGSLYGVFGALPAREVLAIANSLR